MLAVALLTIAPGTARAADLVELRSGARVSGAILSRTEKDVTIQYKIGNYTYKRTYPLSLIRAITTNDRREVIGEPDAAAAAAPSNPPPAGAARGRAEVQALIDKVGSTPPEWFDATPLNYPRSLDLSWPERPGGSWNNQKNVGQYIWDIINTNASKWREGVRFLHFLLGEHKDDPETRTRVMLALGRMYFNLLEDYPRAAFWWQKAGVARGVGEPMAGVHLAECYWRMGSRAMAVDLLDRLPRTFPSIKLWADLGETGKALQIAEAAARGGNADLAYLYAGDACRVAGQFTKAVQYYQKVLAQEASGTGAGRVQKNQGRARANIEAIKLFELSDVSRVPEGTYQASSLGYEAQVGVEVVVRDGRLQSVRVTQHREKQFYAALTDTPRKLIAKQGVKGVDATSGATITSEAIINATAKALAAAAK
jgi:uncharacterized protein with FMN-binding domain